MIRPNATSTTKGADQGGSILLELYLEKGAYNKTVTSLLLEGVTSIRRVLSKSQPRAFEFMKGDTNVALTLAAESETDAQEWMEIFKKLLLPASEQKELKAIEGYGTGRFGFMTFSNLSSLFLCSIDKQSNKQY